MSKNIFWIIFVIIVVFLIYREMHDVFLTTDGEMMKDSISDQINPTWVAYDPATETPYVTSIRIAKRQNKDKKGDTFTCILKLEGNIKNKQANVNTPFKMAKKAEITKVAYNNFTIRLLE